MLAEATGSQQLLKTDSTRLLLIGAEVGSESVRTVTTSLTSEVHGCVIVRYGARSTVAASVANRGPVCSCGRRGCA